MGILSFLFGGCSKQPQTEPSSNQRTDLKQPPEVTSEEEEGFHDLIFYIQDWQKLADGRQSLKCQGNYKGAALGFEIILGKDWTAGSLGKDIPLVTYQGIVTYRSIGTASDKFIQVVDELYGTKLNPKGMATEVSFTGISLGGDPRDLAKEPVRIKLFFDSGAEKDYAELFTNIELETHRLGFHEKDEEYRSAVVKTFAFKQ